MNKQSVLNRNGFPVLRNDCSIIMRKSDETIRQERRQRQIETAGRNERREAERVRDAQLFQRRYYNKLNDIRFQPNIPFEVEVLNHVQREIKRTERRRVN